MPGATSVTGLASGLKTDEIIEKLMELERAPIIRLQTKQMTLRTKLSAWQDANTRILAVKAKADLLAQSTTFDVKSLTSSDESIVKGSTTYQAQAGTYYLTVNSLARAEQQKTQGYAEKTSSVGTGTISITVGSGTAKEIIIDSSNNTLTGLCDAINRAGAGVTAAIVNDGSVTDPYRLVITSNTSGTSGQVTVSANLTGGTSPSFSVMQSAQDASVTLGSGAGAITVTKSTNSISDLIPGVTFNLQKEDPTKTVTVTIQNNTASIKQAINDLVQQYNNLISFVNQQFKYDTSTNSGGTLFADQTLASIHADIISKISNPVAQLAQSIKVLSQIGVTMGSDNKLNVNDEDLDEALAAGIDTIKQLLATVGDPSSGYVSFLSCTEKTKASGAGGYAIEVTSVATQSVITAGAAQTENLAQDEQLTVNGVTIDLAAGMTAAQVTTKINEYTSSTGVIASRTAADGSGTGDYLTLRRVGYGSAQKITAVSAVSNGGANTSGLGTTQVTESSPAGETGTGTGAAGTDVAGTINGEAATGTGQVLTGNEGNTNTEGLKVLITATAVGSYGTIGITKGVASTLSEYLSFVTASTTGTISSAQSLIQTQIDDAGKDILALQERLVAKQERLSIQFAIMEGSLSKLQNQGNFLSGQLSAASKGWK